MPNSLKLLFFSVLIVVAGCDKSSVSGSYWVYVSSFSDSTSTAGIGIYDWDPEQESLQLVKIDSTVKRSSYLSLDVKNLKLYSIDRTGIQSFNIEKETGLISMLNQTPHDEYNVGACYISLAENGRYLMIAYYGSGSVATYSIKNDGRIGSLISQVKHEGSGVNRERQEAAHAHMVVAVPSSALIAVTDLGMDKIFCYRISDSGVIDNTPVSMVNFPPGYGPRHLAFHPTKPYVYVLAELTGRVVAYQYDTEHGIGEQIADIEILPNGFTEFNKAADIHISNDGNYLYASNRGANSLAVCKIDQRNGAVELMETPSSGGEWPRAFAIDPSGDYILVANKRSHQLNILSRNKKTGRVEKIGEEQTISFPQCIRFLEKSE